MIDLEDLVNNGLYDKKTNSTIQVRIISSLGDNLEQNEVSIYHEFPMFIFSIKVGIQIERNVPCSLLYLIFLLNLLFAGSWIVDKFFDDAMELQARHLREQVLSKSFALENKK